jgi:hypothetical protein
MTEKWAKSYLYGSWNHHKYMRDVVHVDGEVMETAKKMLREEGLLLGSFGYTESMGYLIGDGFVMQRRLYSDSDFYPELELFSRERDSRSAMKSLGKLARSLGLPNPSKK